MNEAPRLLLNKDGVVLLEKIADSNHSIFEEDIYNAYHKLKFPEKYRYFARRVHFDPLFILSFAELKSYLTFYFDDFEDEDDMRKLIVFYSVFVLNITGEMAVWDIAQLNLDNEFLLLRPALKNFGKFNTFTNLIYKLLSSKNINDEQIRKGEEWKELVERKRKSIKTEPIKYFKDTYYYNKVPFIKTLLK